MAAKEVSAELLNQLLDKLEKLMGRVEFGSIELVFHQGKLVQLEKTKNYVWINPNPNGFRLFPSVNLPVVLEAAAVLTMLYHPNHIGHYVHGDSFTGRLAATPIT